MQKLFPAAALAALLALPSAAQTQPTASELLQKGIYAQETSGDLDGAIKIFHQIADSHPQQREIGAQAQYRLGMALLAKGDTNAASQEIQRLGWDYPDFKDLLASAKNLHLAPPYGPLTAQVTAKDGKVIFFRKDGLGDVLQAQFDPINLPAALEADRKKASAQIADHEAEFNFGEPATVTGTVAQVAWINPYTVLTVINPTGTGAPTRIFVASPNTLMRAGWTRDTLKLGDQITVTGAPGRDGSGTLQATSVFFKGQPLFSRPDGPLPQNAIGAYEK